MNSLAIDFGDGTTTASFYEEGMKEPEILSILPGIKEIPSILGYPVDGSLEEYVIGENALSPRYVTRMNWKKPPTMVSEEYLGGYSKEERCKDTVNFMKKIYTLLVTQNNRLKQHDYFSYIGIPSDWGNDDMNQYQKMAEAAGIPNVVILKESQAATLFARKFMFDNNGKALSDEALNNGLLLIDIGSSTTDFTFIKGLDAQHWGIELGAKYIDWIFLDYAIQKTDFRYSAADSEQARIAMSSLKNGHIFKCRKIKEHHFSLCDFQNKTTMVDSSFRCGIPGGKNYRFEVSDDNGNITEELINQLLDFDPAYKFPISKCELWGKLSWREHFRKALYEIQDKWNINRGKISIVITGGASRMYFIDDDIRSVFGSAPPCFFGSDDQRSFSVVKGLAWAGYANSTIQEKKENIEEKLLEKASRHIGSEIGRAIIAPIALSVTDTTIKNISEKLLQHSIEVNTMRKLTKTLHDTIAGELKKVDTSRFIRELENIIAAYKDTPEFSSLNNDVMLEFGRIMLKQSPVKIDSIPRFTIPSIKVKLNIYDGIECAEDIVKFFTLQWDRIVWDDDTILSDGRMAWFAEHQIPDHREAISNSIIKALCEENEGDTKTLFDILFAHVRDSLVVILSHELDAIAANYSATN